MKIMTTLCLTAIAGFIDTLTFILVGGLFAAHVTGNFVVFGASLANDFGDQDYLKLAAFPIFVISVMIGAALFNVTRTHRLGGLSIMLFLQSVVVSLVAASSYFAPNLIAVSALALALVFTMGTQNSLHRYIPGPMTTVMTGTVMNWAASICEKIFHFSKPELKNTHNKPMGGWMIFAFALGCAAAGILVPLLGFAACVLPAALLLGLSLLEATKQKTL